MLLILGCIVSGRCILNEVPGLTSAAWVPEKGDLSQSFPTVLTRMRVTMFKQPPITREVVSFQFDVECLYAP